MSTAKESDIERNTEAAREGLAWQTGVWDRIAQTYLREADKRVVPNDNRRHRRQSWRRCGRTATAHATSAT